MVWTAADWKLRWCESRELAISHGRVDFRSGKSKRQNPYPAASLWAVNWERGWNDAFCEHEEEQSKVISAP
jgi:hypothetical protein